MPKIVTLPGRTTTPPRKRRGRSLADIIAADAIVEPRPVAGGLRDRPHVSYNPDERCREELARHLMPDVQTRLGVGRFTGHYLN